MEPLEYQRKYLPIQYSIFVLMRTERLIVIQQPQGLEFVPMMWGQNSVADFQNAFNAGVWGASTAILGFNEYVPQILCDNF